MTKLETLFKRTELGQIQEWTMCIDGNKYWSVEGLKNGTLTINKPTTAIGLNIGKSNETTPSQQALKEAQAKHKKKLEKGYSTDIKTIDNDSAYFEPQLAKKYLDYKDDIKFPVFVSRKIDGARLIATKDRLTTRNGKPYINCQHISKMLTPLFAKHPSWVIDCEIYSHDIPFERIMHVVRQTKLTQEAIIESEKTVKIYIFDGIADDPQEGFKSRFNTLETEIIKLIPDMKYIVFVDNYEVNKHEDIKKYHDKFVQEGYEGVMIRVPDAPYQNKRSKNLLKFKEFNDSEFKIADVIEGKGGRSGMVGNLLLEMKDGRTFGSGLRGGEEFYKEIWNNRKALIGKKATVRYQELSADGIPRFPVTVAIDPMDK